MGLVMHNKKTLFGWVMYDFANSSFTTLIVTFVYATYFTKAIAPDEITGTALWSRAITLSALAVAFFSPFLGVMADKGGHRKLFLLIFTGIAIAASCMLYTVLPGETTRALFWFVIGNIAFELGCVFYNAFLPGIAPKEMIGRISGIGWGLGYIGGLLAMFVAMVTLVNPETPWFGISKDLGQNIRATNLLVAAWFGLFSIPMFLFVHDKKSRGNDDSRKLSAVFSELVSTVKEIKKYRHIVRFLLARLIYNDGLITIFAFGGIYAAGTFHFTFQEIMLFGIVLNISAGLGALAMGFLDDLVGGKKTILISLAGLIVASIIAITAESKSLFWLAGIIVGIFSGPNQSASRSLMARFVPPDKENEFFGFFAFSGKFTAFLGPLFLGLLTEFFHSQRAGMSIVLVFFVLGGMLLVTVDEKEGTT
ncbi:MAG: MFS transporter [Desulfobulbaceae bacterium]|nr:MFS transporter [Desulfobulbaceae bacterium]